MERRREREREEGLFIDEGTPVYLGNQLIEPIAATVTTKTSSIEDNIQGSAAINDSSANQNGFLRPLDSHRTLQ